MYTKKLIAAMLFLGLLLESSSGQNTSDWLKVGAVLDLFHVIKGPHSERDEVLAFLNEEYMPVMEEAYPGTFAFHLEGQDGDRKGQHAKFWIFSSVEMRDSYFPKEGGGPTEKYGLYSKALDGKISNNKTIELFRGWDFDFKTDWKIVYTTEEKAALKSLRGLVLDVHYLDMKQDLKAKKLQPYLVEKLKKLPTKDSQFFIIYGDRDTRKKGFAIMELHLPGASQKEVLTELAIKWEKELYSSYKIW